MLKRPRQTTKCRRGLLLMRCGESFGQLLAEIEYPLSPFWAHERKFGFDGLIPFLLARGTFLDVGSDNLTTKV